MIRLLLRSTDRSLESLLSLTLGGGYKIQVEPDRRRVHEILAAESADILILDFDTNKTSGKEELDFISEVRGYDVPIVAMTNDDRRSTAMDLVEHGVYDYFLKPPHLLELKLVIRRAHEQAQLRKSLERAKKQLRELTSCDRLIGSSGRMRVVYDLVRRVKDLNAFVLVQGESGTGKELVARAIHNLSSRAPAPFVAVSCGAIPETLIEAELFGFEKGAFTSATASRSGYLEQAGEGTLLLDEIGELSLATQVKLLRVLQEKEFYRLGSKKIIPLKARVVFATHRDLEEMVEQGTFRQDLYFRINVLPIEVPPLRERPEDIPALAEHFLQEYGATGNSPKLAIEPAAMDLLCNYSWPGNVRELENVIQRAVILNEGDTIRCSSLPDALQGPAPIPGAPPETFEEQLKDYKVKLVNRTVSACNGNKSLAARKLQMTRAHLHRILRYSTAEDATA